MNSDVTAFDEHLLSVCHGVWEYLAAVKRQ